MLIVFLDIDGVLNTGKNYHEYGVAEERDPETDPRVKGRIHLLHRHAHLLFDRELVGNLNTITDATGAQIVVSSSWRLFYSGRDDGPAFPDLVELLKKVGVRARIVGRTPRNLARRFSEIVPRGFEIYAWLDCHPHVKKYVILDDDSDMLNDQMKNFVNTIGHVGLSKEDVEKAIAILRS